MTTTVWQQQKTRSLSPHQPEWPALDPSRWLLIINLSADSFSGDGLPQIDALDRRIRSLIAEDLHPAYLDVGAVSTRPGAKPVSPEDEWLRIEPFIPHIRAWVESTERSARPLKISLDTSHPRVVRRFANTCPLHLLNDIYAGARPLTDESCSTLHVAADLQIPALLMHMQGSPETMQDCPHYDDCAAEVLQFLLNQRSQALQCGVPAVIGDPGIGFGKTLAHNLELLHKDFFERASQAKLPLCIGLSRKSFIPKLAAELGRSEDLSSPQNRDLESKKLEFQCLKQGAVLIRSHLMPSEVQL